MIMKKLFARRDATASSENDNDPERKAHEKDETKPMIFITVGNTSGG